MLEDERVPEEKRWHYAKTQIYFGVLEYVRDKCCRVRFYSRNGIIKEVDRPWSYPDQLPDELSCEQWRRDLKAIEAKMDFDALIAKLEKRCLHPGRGRRDGRAPELRLVAACGSVHETCRQTGLNRVTFTLRLKKLAL